MGRERKRRVNKRTKVKNGKKERKREVKKRVSWGSIEREMRKKKVGRQIERTPHIQV